MHLKRVMNKIQKLNKFIFCFFSRHSGVSKDEMYSLNCALNLGDKDSNVKKNRKIALKKLGIKKKLFLVNQVHSNRVIFLKEGSELDPTNADGIITNREDIVIGILTADCAPIIILGKNNFGIVHAGWRGALSGIIENSVKTMLEIGELKQNLFFFVGPHLKKKIF